MTQTGSHDHLDLATGADTAALDAALTAKINALEARVAALEDEEPPDPPEPPPPTLYGPFTAADTLANTTTDQGPVAYRFIADRSGALSGVRVYFEVGSGYSGGDGGSRQVTLTTDAGAVIAGPVTHSGLPSGNSRFVTFAFSATLVAGTAYRVKFVNSGSGYISCNAIYCWSDEPELQPRFPGWQVLWYCRHPRLPAGQPTSACPDCHGNPQSILMPRERYLPILELHWADGQKTGVGYYGTSQVSPNQSAIGGTNLVRQRMTPKTNVTFTEIWVRLKRDSGSVGTVTVAIAGVTATIPGTAFPIGTQVDAPGNVNAWGKATVPATTLTANVQYDLVVSATGGTFRAQALGRDSWGMTVGGDDGGAEKSSNSGSSWGPCGWYGGTNAAQDLQVGLK